MQFSNFSLWSTRFYEILIQLERISLLKERKKKKEEKYKKRDKKEKKEGKYILKKRDKKEKLS